MRLIKDLFELPFVVVAVIFGVVAVWTIAIFNVLVFKRD